MLAPYDPNHIAQALARQMEQYRNRPLYQGFFVATVTQIQELENSIYSLDAGRQLWNGATTPAIGEQLDQLGTLIGISRNGLTDQEYILFLFGKIAENFSDTTIQTILTVIGYLFQAQAVTLQDIYPAGIYVAVLDPAIPENLFPIAKTLVFNALGAGIKLVIASSPTLGTFRFNGPGVTGALNGFNNGVFAGLI